MANKDEENIGSFYMGRTRTPPEPKRLLPPGVLTVLAVVLLGGIIWYAYPRGAERYTNVDVPVVQADTAPIKEEPVDPGGMEVRHQDSTIFGVTEKGGGAEVERILPGPEEPMNKDEVFKEAAPAAPPDLAAQSKEAASAAAEKLIPPAAPAPAPAAEKPAAKPEVKAEAKAPAKAAAKTPAKPAPVVAGDQYEVRLGSYRDEAGLKTDWERLKKKYAAQLSGLNMRSVKADLGDKGIYYRLQAGMLTKDKAQAICDALKGKVGCILAKQ